MKELLRQGLSNDELRTKIGMATVYRHLVETVRATLDKKEDEYGE